MPTSTSIFPVSTYQPACPSPVPLNYHGIFSHALVSNDPCAAIDAYRLFDSYPSINGSDECCS